MFFKLLGTLRGKKIGDLKLDVPSPNDLFPGRGLKPGRGGTGGAVPGFPLCSFAVTGNQC